MRYSLTSILSFIVVGGALFFAMQWGCQKSKVSVLVGQPQGPYQLDLTISPFPLEAEKEAHLTYQVLAATTSQPVTDLQILHERILHTFIVSQDLQMFSHIHHEDFFPLTDQDRFMARFHYPFTFPHPGQYFIAAEFTHKDRSWVKQFTVSVPGESTSRALPVDPRRTKFFGPYEVSLRASPDPPVAGYDVEFVLHFTRDGEAVTDLGLRLGTEVHMATWKLDGSQFGHQHTYTPAMAALMAMMRDHTSDPDHMARMMVQLMREPAKQVYFGPEIPVHHIFPEPGTYKLFFDCAPGGKPLVVDFMVNVKEYSQDLDTTVHSIVTPNPAVPSVES